MSRPKTWRAGAAIVAVAAAIAVVAPTIAAAETAEQAVRRWGLLGNWSVDCNAPTKEGPGGRLAYYVGNDHKVFHERDLGVAHDTNEVLEAKIASDGSLTLVVRFDSLGQVRQYSLIKGADGRTRAMANSKIDGTQVTVKDGILTGSNKPTQWLTRCQ